MQAVFDTPFRDCFELEHRGIQTASMLILPFNLLSVMWFHVAGEKDYFLPAFSHRSLTRIFPASLT